MAEDKQVSALLEDLAGEYKVKWYKRKKSKVYLPAETNVAIAASSDAVTAYNPYLRIEDQPSFWDLQEEIPMMIRAVSGFTLALAQMGEILLGDFRGTVSTKYEVGTDDRIVDSENRQFKVMSATPNANKKIIRVSLKYLPTVDEALDI